MKPSEWFNVQHVLRITNVRWKYREGKMFHAYVADVFDTGRNGLALACELSEKQVVLATFVDIEPTPNHPNICPNCREQLTRWIVEGSL